MTKLAPEWVRTSNPVIRSPARYRWTTAPASLAGGVPVECISFASLARWTMAFVGNSYAKLPSQHADHLLNNLRSDCKYEHIHHAGLIRSFTHSRNGGPI